jgi:hypothetical protein
MKETPIDKFLHLLAEIRESIPERHRVAELPSLPQPEKLGPMVIVEESEDAVRQFELESLYHSTYQVATELQASLDAAEARLFQQAMDVYYAAEELSRDPAHADLIPLVEDLRATFERDMGYPIPPRS